MSALLALARVLALALMRRAFRLPLPIICCAIEIINVSSYTFVKVSASHELIFFKV